MTMQPHRLVEAHADLAERMRTNVDFERLVKGQIKMLVPSVIRSQTDYQANAAYETMRGAVRGAYCYRVSADMTKLVQHAAMMLDGTDQFDPALAPTGCGLAYFDGGLTIVGARGERMTLSWLLWGPGHFRNLEGNHQSDVLAGVFTAHFNDMLLQPDQIAHDILERHGRRARGAFGRWGFMGCSANAAGERLGPPETEPGVEQYLEIIASGDTPTPGTNITRLTHAFWLLLNQTITYSAPAVGMPPAVKGTAKRARVPGKVSVVELRRRINVNTSADHGERGVEWSHRWIVRGFWRWQHYGPGNKLRKRIWISPYVKGPEDKPLVATERVYDLKR